MKKWLRRIRGVLGMGLTWAVGWGLTGLLIGVASILLPWLRWDLFFEIFDAPLLALDTGPASLRLPPFEALHGDAG